MSEPQIPESKPTQKPSPASGGASGYTRGVKYPNPPDIVNPDAATLRDQWRYAIRQYSRWYSQAWGTAILAGLSFFALGWYIKGSNPITSFDSGHNKNHPDSSNSSSSTSVNEQKPDSKLRQAPP